MPEPQQSNTAPILPEALLAQVIAEYVQVTRQSLDQVRFLRRVFVPHPTPVTAQPQLKLGQCDHEYRYHVGVTGEEDQIYPCRARATVHNLRDAANYCLQHHEKAEASRRGYRI